jgi:sodium--glutamate symport carrier gltS
MLYPASGYRVTFELQIRDVLLVCFFTTIVLNSRLADLRSRPSQQPVSRLPLVRLWICDECSYAVGGRRSARLDGVRYP